MAGASATLLAILLAIETAAGSDAASRAFVYPSEAKAVPSQPSRLNHTAALSFCPDSHPHLTGGGVKIRGDDSGFDLEVASTTGVEHGGWAGAANNSSGSQAQMTTTAVCAKSGHFRYPQIDKTIHPSAQATARARCPAGTKVTGGGVTTDSSGTSKVTVAASEPFDGADRGSRPDDGWLASSNNGTTRSQDMAVTAICAESGHFDYRHSARKPLPNDTEASATAGCPVGTSVTGGGVDNSGTDLGAEIESTFPDPDEDWVGRANNDSTGQAATMQTFAICEVTQTDFAGTFREFDPSVGPATMTFSLTHNHTEVHHWSWVHMPIKCAEGSDVVSSSYGNRDVRVVDDHFHAEDVKSPEGFKTTLDGTLTDHDTEAHGTLSMSGPEPPNSTHCHGTGHWSATAR